MRRRWVPVLLAAAVVAAALMIFAVLRRSAPPEAARLLPAADGVLYIDVSLLRRLGVFSHTSDKPTGTEYDSFLNQTDFHFERDLDEAAFALHAQPGDPYPRFSEVFIGRYQAERMKQYLEHMMGESRGVEVYRDVTIYRIHHEGRSVRVALLGAGVVAASNTDSADAIHHIIDQYRRVALPFRGPSLLADHYSNVPFASLAWCIARVAPALPASGPGLLNQTLRDLAPGALVVASLRFTGRVSLRIDALAQNAAQAKQIGDNVSVYLNLFRSIEANVPQSGTDADVKAVFDSFQVETSDQRATLRADVPIGALTKLAAEPPPAVGPSPAAVPAAETSTTETQRHSGKKK